MMSEDLRSPLRFSHEAMATLFEIWIHGEPRQYAARAAAAVFDEIDRLERHLSIFDPTSEISRLGRLRPGESLAVGEEVFECLKIALRLRKETSGAFAIDYKSLIQYYGRSPGRARLPRRIPPPGFQIERTAGGFAVRRDPGEGPPLRLDLGGIGKGFSLDRCLGVLADWSIECALLHGGTSTALGFGPGPEIQARGWPVGVGDGGPGRPARAFLHGRAMSGSGREVKGDHILNPRSGRPAAGFSTARVSCASAAESDALSTAFLVMGEEETAVFCRNRPDVWALTVAPGGRVRVYNPEALDTEQDD